MDRLPEIGERVRYEHDDEFLGHRACIGTVRKIYPGLTESGFVTFKDDPDSWAAGIEVDDPLPGWWPYPNTNRFAPSVTDLTPIAAA